MAEEHNQLKYGSPISIAASVLSGGGYGDVGISRISESLVAILNIFDRDRPEFAIVRGERIWAVNPSQAAVAGEFQQVGIRNPVASTKLVVVQDIRFGDHGGADPTMNVTIAASGAVDALSTPQSRDTRLPGQTQLVTQSIATSGAAVLGTRIMSIEIASQSYGYYPIDVVLAPGFDLFVGPASVNQVCDVSFRGYERVAFPGELQARG